MRFVVRRASEGEFLYGRVFVQESSAWGIWGWMHGFDLIMSMIKRAILIATFPYPSNVGPSDPGAAARGQRVDDLPIPSTPPCLCFLYNILLDPLGV